jgi:hypothetical protein
LSVDFQKGRLARDFESGHEADAIGLETMAASFAAVAVLEPEIECYRTVARHVRSISQRSTLPNVDAGGSVFVDS